LELSINEIFWREQKQNRIKIGSTESIEVYAECEIDLSMPPVTRSLFGDIISPIRGLLTEAFNEFKGPVQDIVHFVVSNVLGGLIKFIATAVEDVFPGFGNTVAASGFIIDQLITIVPKIAGVLESEIRFTMLIITGTSKTVHKDIKDVLEVAADTFDALLKLQQTAYAQGSVLMSKLTTAFDGLTATVNLDLTNTMNADVPIINEAVATIGKAIGTLPTAMSFTVRSSVVDTCLVFQIIAENILTVAKNLLHACENMIDIIVKDFEAALNESMSIVQDMLNEANTEVNTAVKLAIVEVKSVKEETCKMLATVTKTAIRTSERAKTGISDASFDIQKGLHGAVHVATKIDGALVKIIRYIDNLGTIFAVTVVGCLVFLLILTYRDYRKYNGL
jgi:hypothetical protein